MSEKSNVERLGDDLKDVAQDATNNEAVKAPGEKISEMEMARQPRQHRQNWRKRHRANTPRQ